MNLRELHVETTLRVAPSIGRAVGPQKHELHSDSALFRAFSLVGTPALRVFADLRERAFVLLRTRDWAA